MSARFKVWLLLASLIATQVSLGQEVESKRVLVIYGNADLSPWIQMYNRALTEGVDAGSTTFLQIEFLELTQYSDTEKLSYAKAIFEKSKKFPPDLVVGVLPGANDFLHEYLPVLAPNSEALYVLPSERLRLQLEKENNANIINSYWSQASVETRDLVKRLFPRAEHLYYIVGTSEGNLTYYRRTLKAFENVFDEDKVKTLSGYTPDELRETFLAAPPNSVAVYVTVDHDRFGIRYTDADLMALIQNDVVPIFGIQDTLLGSGVIGGSFTSAALYGLSTAELVREVLNLPGKVEPINATGTQLVVDDEVLEMFGISHDVLPDNVTHLNHEVTVWQEYWRELLIGLTIITLQTLMILLLFAESQRRKRTERARDNQSRLFDSVINGISDAIVVADQSGRIVATNSPGFESTFKVKPDQVQGKLLRELFGDEVASEESLSAIVHCVREQRFFPGETVIKPILDVEGKSVGYFAVVRDVSERLAREEELRQAHKMEAVGNLAGGIAHDFNNILMAIVGNAELALDVTAAGTPQRDLLQRILNASDRARDLVKQIMSFSRRDEGEVMEAANLSTLLNESTALIETSFPSSIVTHIDTDTDLWLIEANPTQIQQIVLNLCSNANHAMGGNGVIQIKAENVEFPSEQYLITTTMPAGRYVALRISDSGVGIDESSLPHIFDPFFTTKGRGEGTGMGLAMVYRIVSSHEAFIDLQTGKEGSCFSIYFPAKDVIPILEPAVPSDLASLDAGIRPHVLLVDDDEMVLTATEGVLIRIGCEVVSFLDPALALEEFQQRSGYYDLLVSDQVMPGLSGLQLIDAVRTIEPIPAILCTGNAEVSQLQGINGVSLLRKPYTQAQLATLVASVILTDQGDTLQQQDAEINRA